MIKDLEEAAEVTAIAREDIEVLEFNFCKNEQYVKLTTPCR
jgi:hypothetical protein